MIAASNLMRRSTVGALVIGLIGVLAGGAARSADLDAGRKIAEGQCAACHGKDGKTPLDPSYPKLAGQYEDYLRKALNDYYSGARKNAIMNGLAKPLKKEDIANVAAYFASLPGPLNHQQ